MHTVLKLSLFSSLLFGVIGPLALAEDANIELPAALQQRVEAQLRSMADFPPATTLTFRILGPSELPGFDRLACHYASALEGASGDVSLLVSHDRTRIAQFTAYDIAADPRTRVPSEGRPSRGGPSTAPVLPCRFRRSRVPILRPFS